MRWWARGLGVLRQSVSGSGGDRSFVGIHHHLPPKNLWEPVGTVVGGGDDGCVLVPPTA